MNSDYYSTIYAWFERCGIISNIRTHLRHNLVNALKSTDMTLNKDNSEPKSAKQYIYDLLIAEYLWNHNYAYTLSVFASEAPLLINFRKHIKPDSEDADKQKLQRDYVTHALETLGIRPEDPDGQSIIADYDNNDMPLLLTILKFIYKIKFSSTESARVDLRNCGTQTDFKVSEDILREKRKIISARKKLLEQKESYNSQLKEYEDKVNKRADIVEEQMILLDDKLIKVQNMIQDINEREGKLIKEKEENERYIFVKNQELIARENLLAHETKRLQSEQDNYKIFENNLKKLQDELGKVQQELSSKKQDKVIRTHEISTQTEVITCEKVIINNNDNDEEKKQLQSLVQEQQLRIEELTLRAVRLSRQLEEAQLLKPVIEVTRPVFSKTQTILSESSSTDDIIQDAKQRLKRLEEESLKADQSYFNCITGLPL